VLTGNRLLYRDGIPIAVIAGGKVTFLETLDVGAQWEGRKALLRAAMPKTMGREDVTESRS
jgi:ATP-dependent Lhr-like helicase